VLKVWILTSNLNSIHHKTRSCSYTADFLANIKHFQNYVYSMSPFFLFSWANIWSENNTGKLKKKIMNGSKFTFGAFRNYLVLQTKTEVSAIQKAYDLRKRNLLTRAHKNISSTPTSSHLWNLFECLHSLLVDDERTGKNFFQRCVLLTNRTIYTIGRRISFCLRDFKGK